MSSPSEPPVEPSTPTESAHREEVAIRRSPRYLNFALLGAVAGVIAALAITFGFPNTSDFSITQIFGFFLLICVVAGVAVAMVVAIILERVVGRATRPAIADKIDVSSEPATIPDAEDTPENPGSTPPISHDRKGNA